MARPVNLLHWRERRRRECLRFWGLMFAGAWLIALTLIIAGRTGQTYQHRWQELRQESDRALLQAFVQRERLLSAGYQRLEILRKEAQQREDTRRWQSTLEMLAQQIPEQAWLTALQWQGNVLSLSGLANRFPALSQMDSAVRSLPGFYSVTAGSTRRDEQGRWQFGYQLQAGGSDVDVR